MKLLCTSHTSRALLYLLQREDVKVLFNFNLLGTVPLPLPQKKATALRFSTFQLKSVLCFYPALWRAKPLRVPGVGNQIYAYRRKPVYCITLYFAFRLIGFRGFAIIRRNSQRNAVKAVSFEYCGNCNYIFQFILTSKTLICGDFFFRK